MQFEDLTWLFENTTANRGTIRQNFNEAALLWKAVKATQGPILEIGRFRGGSTALLAAAAGTRNITSIDIQDAIDPDVRAFLGTLGNVRILLEDSRKPLEGFLEPFGLMFVDGDHSFAGCSADIEAHWGELAAGGAAVFHDASPNSDTHGTGTSTHCEGVNRVVWSLIDTEQARIVDTAGSSVWLEKLK